LPKKVEQDRDSLLSIMRSLAVRISPFKAPLALMAERMARVKLNGRLLSRSPLSTLEELEAMQLGMQGKMSGWQTLRRIAGALPALDTSQLDRLLDRAQHQTERLQTLRLAAVDSALGHPTQPLPADSEPRESPD
jgi:hypothetical protein